MLYQESARSSIRRHAIFSGTFLLHLRLESKSELSK